ncbi:MAG: hypothetical protein R3277_13080 [Brumimicrobium sp.]|nr:hypothetical protein [Brumimicrobium sp.]
MKNLIFLFSFGVVLLACKKNSDDCDPNMICYTEKPDSLYIELRLSPNPSGDPIEVRFFIGNVNDGELYHTFFTNSDREYFHMPVGQKYAAEARYKENGNTIVAVDGDRLEAEYKMNCDLKCYEWNEDLVLDLELK